jgi:YYY domain-containing protein
MDQLYRSSHAVMIRPTMSNRSLVDSGLPYLYIVAVAIILLVAAVLRFYGQDWDDGHYFHPDERFIATVMDNRLSVPDRSNVHLILDPAKSPLNTRSDGDDDFPQAFAYGSLPFIVATFLGTFVNLGTESDLTAYANVGQFGRFLTVIVDLGTVALVILFAREAFGRLASVIAGSLAAASVILVQLAHFFTVDTWVTFFTIAVLYACLFVMRSFNLRWSLIAAALGGAALATKVSVGLLGIPIIVAMILGARTISTDWAVVAGLVIRRLAISVIPAVAVFALFEPYAIWRPRPFIDDIRTQWEIVNGHFDIPFTRQFVGTISGITEIENLILWGVAPGFGLAALIATFIGIYWAFRDRDPRYLLLLSWILPYFYVIASSEARFLRYSAPLVPALAVIVGHQLAYARQVADSSRIGRSLAGGAIVLVVGITLLWSLAFTAVYRDEHPRIEASRWIYENVEPGSTLTREVWDDTLPVSLSGVSGSHAYHHLSMDLYVDRPNQEAFDYIADVLHEADYVVLASQRLSHSIPRLPWRYPVQSAYYRLLEQEMLGFELAHESTSYPGVGSFRINTLRADESFSVYDHPPVRVYRKVEELPRDELELRFAHALNQPWVLQREPPEQTLLLSQPVSEQPIAHDVGWSSAVTRYAPAAILVWLFTVGMLGVAAYPLARRLFPRFSDRGLGFNCLVGLLGVGIIVWLLWSLDLLPFTTWTVLIAFAALAGSIWIGIGVDGTWLDDLRTQWRPIVAGQAVFLAAFAVFLLLRALNPDLWHPIFGGEKAMETAYLNAIARSESFPPYDPWFADGYINYYYYGFFLVAILWKLTGIPPDIGFQLAVATIAAFLAAGVFSLASTVSSAVLHTRRSTWLLGGGLLAVGLTLLAGNLDAIRQIIGGTTLSVDFWQSSRVVDFAITEFPYFSLLYGDLHPHLIAAPVLVLVLALAYSWIQNGQFAGVSWIVIWSLAGAVAIGSLTFINFWDGPTAGIILVAAMTMPLIHAGRGRARGTIQAVILIPIVGVFAWLLFQPFRSRLYTPTDGLEFTSAGTDTGEWFTHFGAFVIAILIVTAVALVAPLVRRGVSRKYVLFGGGLAVGGFLLALMLGASDAGNGASVWINAIVVALVGGLIAQASAWIPRRIECDLNVVPLMPFIAAGGALAAFRPVAAISAFLVALFLLLWMASARRSVGTFLAICGAAAAGLVLTADLIYVTDHLRGSEWERMNTVFKLYFQAWTLFAITASAAIIWLARRIWHSRSVPPSGENTSTVPGGNIRVFSLVAGTVLVVVLLAYPVLGTPDRLEHRMDSSPSGLSLSGYEWMDGGEIRNQAGETIDFTGDYQAIEWLTNEATGNEVILEAAIGPYRGGGSRISSATGMPAILGWDSHQSQQRGSAAIQPRSRDVRELYRTDDIGRKRFLLRQYNVRFVVVGDVERFTIFGDMPEDGDPDSYSTPEGLEAFETMVGSDLEIVFESGGTRIYRVVPFPTAGQAN